ncbi:uncharacterized protein B0J16DRAFT_344100 [Fusarium flagelliforme]|uniref:uncharacterized protein n=1 Tax=Fusarium flagelliforme TaxID=2675880 RepID=UPI001E8E3FAB|nr:uncharacterized protein B0J16DRAFT_344100 [Fusarium flagelliforme]KAH7182678.1 hypothetical protein B0J16DRAFT_344100 [Fusarium flagelliforme]
MFCPRVRIFSSCLYLFLWLFSYSDIRMRLMRKELLHRVVSSPFPFVSYPLGASQIHFSLSSSIFRILSLLLIIVASIS